MELVGGDDQGEYTAINDELHPVFFIRRVQVHVDNFLENRFVRHIIAGKQVQSSSLISQSRTPQKYVLNVFIDVFRLSGWVQAIPLPVG